MTADLTQQVSLNERIQRLFQFLKGFNELRYPTVHHLRDYSWQLKVDELPEHEDVEIAAFRENELDDAVQQDFVVRVGRPRLQSPPDPPESIRGWLEIGWDNPSRPSNYIVMRDLLNASGVTNTMEFVADPNRVLLYNSWATRRDLWAESERPARKAHALYERIFDTYMQMKREGERFELVLGDGIVDWRTLRQHIHHPILLKKLSIEFDETIPEFRLVEADAPVEFHTLLFGGIEGINGGSLAAFRTEVADQGHHPLGGDGTTQFLKRVIQSLSSQGEFVEGDPRGEGEGPRIGRSPIVFLRKRAAAYAAAIEAILSELDGTPTIPTSLINISTSEGSDHHQDPDHEGDHDANEDEQVLFCKPANDEQLQIAKRLRSYHNVVVQGPPGTGKTHTIANLIGHLLAEGKSVLVTAFTAKALQVLREKVPRPLQPLCLSLLDNDTESRLELEGAVREIVGRLSSDTPDALQRVAKNLDSQRHLLLNELRNKRKMLQNAIADEYRDIIIAGRVWSPSDAAKLIRVREQADGWIPGRIEQGSPLPLSVGEFIELYRTNGDVTAEEEAEISYGLPAVADLMRPRRFVDLVSEWGKLSERNLDGEAELWSEEAHFAEPSTLERIGHELFTVLEFIPEDGDWRVDVIEAGRLGSKYRDPWDKLVIQAEDLANEALESKEHFYEHAPVLDERMSNEEYLSVLQEILTHFDHCGSLTWPRLLLHKSWRQVRNCCRVGNAKPSKRGHFEALLRLASLKHARVRFLQRWARQVEAIGGPVLGETGEEVEVAARRHIPLIKRCLDWYAYELIPLVDQAKSEGLDWERALASGVQVTAHDIRGMRAVIVEEVLRVFWDQADRVRSRRLQEEYGELHTHLSEWARRPREGHIVESLFNAVEALDPEAYARACDELDTLVGRQTIVRRRKEFLQKLEQAAPAWAATIRTRSGQHGSETAPSNIESAWLWLQLKQELDARAERDVAALQRDIERLKSRLFRTTAELVESRTWGMQLNRTSRAQRQALVGWSDAVKRIGRGTGIRAAQLRVEARKLMAASQSAVPVWIMPLVRVAESFKPSAGLFDVVIIDEASQCDVMGLVALYLGKEVVVVGDNEQVSPEAVAEEIEPLRRLREEYLDGIPNSVLYDGKLSIYDLANESFGGVICLREHFRCVPEIIQFSNHLCYEGRIRPLRESAASNIKPAVISYRVEGGYSDSKVNEREGFEISSLVAAAIEQPEYSNKTFGVISLVGEEQARWIERLLSEHVDPVEFERRRILCGNPPHFQGDERHVMFLSVVDSKADGLLSIRRDDRFRKRFNVAASRGQDQLWVVHSLNPQRNLQPGDLRRRLIEFSLNPSAYLEETQEVDARTESPFEEAVRKRLVSEGYLVEPQWQVGYYRIDLVVHDGDRRLAIECDGDRYHPIEQIPADMARQAILERMEWKFVRIRGSKFYRDPEGAMEPVFDKIERMGIERTYVEEVETQPESSKLLERVIRRAAELRREWGLEEVVEGVRQPTLF